MGIDSTPLRSISNGSPRKRIAREKHALEQASALGLFLNWTCEETFFADIFDSKMSLTTDLLFGDVALGESIWPMGSNGYMKIHKIFLAKFGDQCQRLNFKYQAAGGSKHPLATKPLGIKPSADI
jgi:hypothetical protein